MISVGSVTLSVKSFDGWDYPSFGSLVAILSDGSTARNEVLQSGALPRLRATLSGQMLSAADVAAVRTYNASKETVAFLEEEDNSSADSSMNVCVLDFQVSRVTPWLWTYTLTLVEAEPDGSS